MDKPQVDIGKRCSAEHALRYINSDMTIGLGTGSTAEIFIDLLAKKIVVNNLKVKVVPTSTKTKLQAEKLGFTLGTLDQWPQLDLVVDGADEIDPNLNLIKGGGGALLQEKIVAAASKKVIIIADQTKLVDFLGSFPLPIEIVRFGSNTTLNYVNEFLNDQGYREFKVSWRMSNDQKFVTDEGHYIMDISMKKIVNTRELEIGLKCIVGIVETGLFCDTATIGLIGSYDGSVKLLEKAF